MRQQLWCISWVCALALMWATAAAQAEPPAPIPAASPLGQMCAAAELQADVDPAPERPIWRMLQTAVRAELRSMVRSEVQRDLRPGRPSAAPGVGHADNGAAETRGNVAAAAGEAAAQAQQARRNQDVAAARAKGLEHAPLTGGASGTSPRPAVR